jgi:hypothetical protein
MNMEDLTEWGVTNGMSDEAYSFSSALNENAAEEYPHGE